MDVLKIAAFSDGNSGGNPAGVVIADNLPNDQEMQRIAAKVGFSETAFAMPSGTSWRVRYFSPESEVPFCGHATIPHAQSVCIRRRLRRPGNRQFNQGFRHRPYHELTVRLGLMTA